MILVDGIFGFDASWRMTHRKLDHHTTMVSHGHFDHLPSRFKGKKIIASPETEKVLRLRKNISTAEFIDDENVKMRNAGHAIGSVMFHFQEQDILYTGDFNTQKTYCGQAKPEKCDTLIMEGTFGHPQYIFPPRELIVEDLMKYLDEHPRSVIKAYSFGKSQEMCHILEKHKMPFRIESPQTRAINDVLGLKFRYERDDATVLLGQVKPAGYRSVAVSGWAVDPQYRFQAGVDAAFPLSDHSDFPSLLEFARNCDPRKIRVFHGGAHAHLVSSLKKLGFDAEQFPLPHNPQKELLQFA